MVRPERWQQAQAYERGYWLSRADDLADSNDLAFYRWRSEQLCSRLGSIGLGRLTDGTARMVEIGSGPVGIAAFFPGVERIAVDPLSSAYAEHEGLVSWRDPDVQYRDGMGEDLPCEADSADLIVIENCIDHARDVDQVMREIVRVLKPGGVLYLTVNCRTRPGFVVHRILSRLRLDPGHPHTFTLGKTRRLMGQYGFRILDFRNGAYWKALRDDLLGPGIQPRLKALLGVSEFVASVVARLP